MILLNLISIQCNVFKRGGYIEPLLIFWHIHHCDIGGMQDTAFPESFLGFKSCASHGSSNYSLIMFTLLVSENRARSHWSGFWKVTSFEFSQGLEILCNAIDKSKIFHFLHLLLTCTLLTMLILEAYRTLVKHMKWVCSSRVWLQSLRSS